MAVLYVVGTPIGNLGDFSPRAAEILETVDFIAAEDTRVTWKLLNHLGIKKPMVSYYEHNLRERGQLIAGRILAGESCAVVSDAGMPCISDPGEDLVRLCAGQGIEIYVIPGPSAAVSALAVSGLSTSRFTFEGFLSMNRGNRKEHLASLKREFRTMVFYEAPHKLLTTLQDFEETFGGDRALSVCRELTKIHEQVIRTTVKGALDHFSENAPKGEFVLVLEGAPAEKEKAYTLKEAVLLAKERMAAGSRATDASREAAKETGFSKAEIYRLLVQKE